MTIFGTLYLELEVSLSNETFDLEIDNIPAEILELDYSIETYDLEVASSEESYLIDINSEETTSNIDFDMDIRFVMRAGDADEYSGPYHVIPEFYDQSLPTKDTYLSDDVTVESIFVNRVSNLAGGKTVFIGGTFNG